MKSEWSFLSVWKQQFILHLQSTNFSDVYSWMFSLLNRFLIMSFCFSSPFSLSSSLPQRLASSATEWRCSSNLSGWSYYYQKTFSVTQFTLFCSLVIALKFIPCCVFYWQTPMRKVTSLTWKDKVKSTGLHKFILQCCQQWLRLCPRRLRIASGYFRITKGWLVYIVTKPKLLA